MNNYSSMNKTVTQECQELKEQYPDVLEKWRRFGDPLQQMMVEIIDKNAGAET